MLEWIRFFAVALCVLGGLFILVCAVAGTFKFRYVLNRMHAAAMGDTLGLMFALLGLIIGSNDVYLMLKLVLTLVFLWCASPVSSHLICRLETLISGKWDKPIEL